MKGNNVLILCQAEIIEALNFYFKERLFHLDNCPEIKSIYADTLSNGNTQVYKISLQEKENTNDN
jgi:hypothetical protein